MANESGSGTLTIGSALVGGLHLAITLDNGHQWAFSGAFIGVGAEGGQFSVSGYLNEDNAGGLTNFGLSVASVGGHGTLGIGFGALEDVAEFSATSAVAIGAYSGGGSGHWSRSN